MRSGDVTVLLEDNHLLAVNKPPGMATMGVATGITSLAKWAKQYIKRRYRKPGNVYLGIVSRLDAGTSGVVLFARTSKAAARLTEQFRTRAVQKTYWAIVAGDMQPPQGELVDWVAKDEVRQRMAIVDQAVPGAKLARLHYRTLRSVRMGTWLEVELDTGRKHQIRLQLAARGYPVLGERKYARAALRDDAMALHARKLVFQHPVRGELIEIVAPPPAIWRSWETPTAGA
jgi:23S rRNA pseudouridine1911/1915/1917 synthase